MPRGISIYVCVCAYVCVTHARIPLYICVIGIHKLGPYDLRGYDNIHWVQFAHNSMNLFD